VWTRLNAIKHSRKNSEKAGVLRWPERGGGHVKNVWRSVPLAPTGERSDQLETINKLINYYSIRHTIPCRYNYVKNK